MAGRDYILCRDCGDKLIYDGSDNIRSRLEGTYGDPSAPDWTVELVCPPCLKKIEDKQAEPVAEPVDFVSLLREADEIVRGKPTWRRFIDGTPLSNDIAVWMTVFAQDVARRAAPPHQQQAEPVAEQAEPDGSTGWSVEVEREACAQLCADYTEWGHNWGQDSNHMAAEAATNECADAIRARGRQTPHQQQAEPVESSAERTLSLLGYTNEGGNYWKPPLGKRKQTERVLTEVDPITGITFKITLKFDPEPMIRAIENGESFEVLEKLAADFRKGLK